MAGRSCTVFIGNIPYDATEEDLRGVFSKVGTINSLRLVYDKETKQPKGYAFCDYVDADTALSAIRNLNEVECNGRRLRIDLADNALRARGGPPGGGSGPPLPLALTAPDVRRPSLPPSLPAAGPIGPTPVGPPLPSGVGPLRPPGPPPGRPGGPMAEPAGPSPEAVIAAVSAHSEIAQTVAAMPQAQLQICLAAMQKLAVEAPEGSRAFLQDNPQLTYALLHAQLLLGLTLDPQLPAAEDEIQQLRAEATRRVANVVPPGMGFMVPPGMVGFPGGHRPNIMGPMVGLPGCGARPFITRPPMVAPAMGGCIGGSFGAAVQGGGIGAMNTQAFGAGLPPPPAASFPPHEAEVGLVPKGAPPPRPLSVGAVPMCIG